MAFVFASERKMGEPHQKEQFPSPAHYSIKEAETLRNCAPFRTTSLRKVAFEENINKQAPGPGEYNVAKEIIKPRITTYTNPNNVIIKVNSTGTPQFKSLTKRFDPPQAEALNQPQYDQNAYYIVKKDKKKPARNPIINRTLNNSIKKFPPSIPTKIRGLLNPQNNQIIKIPSLQPGPGDYEILNKQRIVSKGTIWCKDRTKRFKDAVDVDNGGPGLYDIGGDFACKNREQSSNFKSGTVRTFFDTIMYNSCSEYIAEHRKKIDFKSPSPAPGQYTIEKPSFSSNQIKPPKFQFFGSSVKRFKNQELNMVQNDSNTFYIPITSTPMKSFNHLNPSFNSSTQRSTTFLSVGQQANTPGPGQYADHIKLLKQKTGKNVQKFGSTTERIPPNTNESIQVAPAVNQAEVQLENQLLKSRFGQLDTQSSIFKSKTHRICFSQAKNVTINLDYDVTFNDVSKKIQRQKAHLQNLRRIDVYKPPFEVNSPRFSHYQEWNNEMRKEDKSQNKKSEKKQTIPEKVVSIGGKIGRQQRFHSERKGGGIPGVGNYQYKNQWKKNSHNVMFKYDN